VGCLQKVIEIIISESDGYLMIITLIFGFAFVCTVLILILAVSSLFSKSFQFWPPPEKSSWQYYTFWVLFRLLFISIIFLSIFDFNTIDFWQHPSRFYIGFILSLVGFSLAFYITYYLGWKNAHGEEEGLITKGWYAWSRNPIYFVSFFGFIGWALVVNSLYVYMIFVILIGFYIFAPFLEEPWLEKLYGEDYLNYKESVPRFFGVPKAN